MEQYLSLLQWLLPSGGLGLLLGWITSRRLRSIRTQREEHDAYKMMYEHLSAEIEHIIAKDKERTHENNVLQERVSILERALHRIGVCPHARVCPILHELRKPQTGGYTDLRRLIRGHEGAGKDAREHRKPPGGESATIDTDDEPLP